MPERVRVRVRGQVQGVGFRPFVYRLARRSGLRGYVLNDGEGVLLEAEGEGLEGFLASLAAEAPPLARIGSIETEAVPAGGETGFAIRESRAGGTGTTASIPADAATCPACLEELFDPGGRRYRYPFLNCTHCGPRYTITRRLPYDRASTSMAGFKLCPDCVRDFADPDDRRFHAQPIACPACGPRLSMPIEEIRLRLQRGEIVAIKGLGGFHLACDARNEAAVAELRRRKRREAKPFAIMVADLAALRRLAICGELEAAQLESPARPILLLRRLDESGLAPSLAPSLAPGLDEIGVMLPCMPLQHLLFEGLPDLALVMTSANPGGEPLVTGNAEAASRLAGIADAIVEHDRDIVIRTDDSVMRITAGAPRFIRRARGFVPVPIPLARKLPPVLAVGGHLKTTLCVIRGDEAFVSQHIGDLGNAASIRFLEETAAHFLSILEVEPVLVAHDRHPDFASTRFAQGLDLPVLGVQHHHAHIAAIVAEHQILHPVLGLVLDGFGLGPAGESWGGELLLADGQDFHRLGHLAPLRQPGGDAASRAPWRMAAAVLHRLGRDGEIASRFGAHGDAAGVARLLDRGVRVPETTSCGRLFDAAAGLLGVCMNSSYEGQAPMLLEALAGKAEILQDGWRIEDGVLDLLPLLEALAGFGPEPENQAAGAALFHGTLAAALVELVAEAAAQTGLKHVALGGGCLLNRILAEALVAGLEARGLTPLLARELPPNDGGLSLGQAYIAALTFDREK